MLDSFKMSVLKICLLYYFEHPVYLLAMKTFLQGSTYHLQMISLDNDKIGCFYCTITIFELGTHFMSIELSYKCKYVYEDIIYIYSYRYIVVVKQLAALGNCGFNYCRGNNQ